MNLSGRHIIVTGAAAGIGLGIATQCIAAGAQVTGFDIDAGGRARLDNLGARFDQVDVADNKNFEQAIEAAAKQLNRLDGLVNNAGITINVPFLDMTLEQMETLWKVNQRSVLVGSQVAGRIMANDSGGAIVNIASNHAHSTMPGHEAYAGTKGAIVAMTRAMAWSLGDKRVRVNALCPGLTRTEIVEDAIQDPNIAKRFRSWSADNELSSVDEIGAAAVFLLSDASSALNGSHIVADRAMSSLLGTMNQQS